ncbi:hypothetical protein TrVE_jg6984 [Triparma verrucosa]|uniref:Glycerophosphocholine acyltransferase 1 n=2 Tax=Triparma TaxID=722752 RepID=A0A9W7E8I0_9STRA|nr:hypothetical protein TrST_g3190 [Triparma strigata]GMH88523.1 hypothetical protein TrVE_jg6984 [Triparma verrucosa]
MADQNSDEEPGRRRSPRTVKLRKRAELLVKPSDDRPVFGVRISGFFLLCIALFLFRFNTAHWHGDDAQYPDRPDPYISHPAWLLSDKNWHYYVLTFSTTSVMWYINFVSTPSFLSLRPAWSYISLLLLCKKLYDFYNFGRLLYLIDFCYFANFSFAYALWNVPMKVAEHFDEGTSSYSSHTDRPKGLKGAADKVKKTVDKVEKKIKMKFSKEFPVIAKAIFCVMNGPVGGGTFMLGTALAFHHPDAFSSFWLHVVPMWFTYALRWRYYPMLLKKNYPDLFEDIGDWRKRDTYIAALKYFYLPWVVAHALFLIVHPYTPLAKYETLFDWVCYGGLPEVRTDPFWTWVGKVLAYCLAHFVLSSQGLAAAALSFKYQLVHFVWICCVFFNCAYGGFKFYEDTVNPPTDVDLSGTMSPLDGIKRSALAWCFLIPAYIYCAYFPERSTIARSDVKRRKEEGKKRD